MSNTTSTRVSDVLACWPPGPPLRENRQRSSLIGIEHERLTTSISVALMPQRYVPAVTPTATRVIRLAGPLDLAATVRPVRRGGIDPCTRIWAGECWRATRTPAGPVTLHLRHCGGDVVGEAWGDGADWALDHVPDLLGLHDDPDAFRPHKIGRAHV